MQPHSDPETDPAAATASPARPRDARVRAFMSAPVVWLSEGSSVAEALAVMRRRDIRHLPIVNAEYRLVGILSDRALEVAKRERGVDPHDVTVDEVMTRDPYTVHPESRLDDAASGMARGKFGCAVVVDHQHPVGMLSITDVLRAFVSLRAEEHAAHAP